MKKKILITLDTKFITDFNKYWKKNRPAVSNFTQAVRIAMYEMMQNQKESK